MASQEDARRHSNRSDRTVWIGVVTAVVAAIGALAFNAFSAMATNTQIELSRQAQFTERFGRAVEQLGSKESDVQIVGIYELEQLANLSDDRRLVIYEVLAGYIRNHRLIPSVPPYQELRTRAPNVDAALTVLARRNPINTDHPLDLATSTLEGAVVSDAARSLNRANLGGVNLNRVDLGGALLNSSDLHGAILIDTCLDRAQLRGADLRGAYLRGADLRDANLQGADLRGAKNLRDAQLQGAVADSNTKWPSEVDWKAEGVRAVPREPGPPPVYSTRPPRQTCGPPKNIKRGM